MKTAFQYAVVYHRLNKMAQEMLSDREMGNYESLLHAMELVRASATEDHGADEFYNELEDLQ